MGRCILVLGIHRSGSSAVAGVLHHLGVSMGPQLLGSHSSNPLGHFEDSEFVVLNEEIIGDWKNPNTSNIIENQQVQLKELVALRNKDFLWGVKDLRLCITAKWIFPLLDDVRIIVVSRPLGASVGSLMVRDGLTRDEAQRIQLHYRTASELLLQQCEIPIYNINYEALVSNPGYEVPQLAQFISEGICTIGGLAIRRASDFIEPQLHHWANREPLGKTSIVIPAVGNVDLTAKCINSIREFTEPIYEIILVDNGSEPEESAELKMLGADKYLWSHDLLGYPAACNWGAGTADGDYLLLMNNDVAVHTDGWLRRLKGTLERSGASIVSPATNFVANPDQHIDNAKDRFIETESLMFVCVLMRKSTFDDFGGLDESYNAGNSEDLDFCEKLRRAGGRFLVDGEVFVHHKGHQTFQKLFDPKSFNQIITWNHSQFTRKYQPEGFGQIAVGTTVRGAEDLFFRDWTRALIRGFHPGDMILEPAIGLPTHTARNLLVMKFLETSKDTLLFIDSDTSFEPETIEALRSDGRTFGYDIVQALVSSKKWPPKPIVLNAELGPNGIPHEYNKCDDFEIGEITERDACGMAITLIRRWIFEAMTEVGGPLYTAWFACPDNWGEDTFFCYRAKQLGAKICVNTAVEVGHVGSFPLYYSVYKQGKFIKEGAY